MKSIILLTTLTLACAACANESAPEAGASPLAVSEQAQATQSGASRPAVTLDGTQNAVASASPAAEPAFPLERSSSPASVPQPRNAILAPDASRPAARRISPGELRLMIDRGEAVLVDVRAAGDWAARHASEAIHIPDQDLFARSVELPHEKLIALYCT